MAKKKRKTSANASTTGESLIAEYPLTLRIPADVNDALDRYIAKQTSLARQKKKMIVAILRRFLQEIGEL